MFVFPTAIFAPHLSERPLPRTIVHIALGPEPLASQFDQFARDAEFNTGIAIVMDDQGLPLFFSLARIPSPNNKSHINLHFSLFVQNLLLTALGPNSGRDSVRSQSFG